MRLWGIKLAMLAMVVAGCAHDPWSRGDTYREAVWEGIHAIDTWQTLDIARHPDEFQEYNPIMGRHPSEGEVAAYMGVWAMLHPVISYLLPRGWREGWQWVTIGGTAACVGVNASAGIGGEW